MEKVKLFSCLIKWLVSLTPSSLLRFIGIMSVIINIYLVVYIKDTELRHNKEIMNERFDRAQDRIDFYSKLIKEVMEIRTAQNIRQIRIDSLNSTK